MIHVKCFVGLSSAKKRAEKAARRLIALVGHGLFNNNISKWKEIIMLQIQQVTGGYRHSKIVNRNVTFEVRQGEIVGLIGLNGAGKSTTIKQILGILKPFKGEIKLNGKTLMEDPNHFRSHICYIPETPQFYEELTLWEHLEFTAYTYQIPKQRFEPKAHELLEKFRMTNRIHDFPHTFSKGMQQKLMIMSAMLSEASFYIIDEPFVGLDALAIDMLINMLIDLKEKGTGILISTHILAMATKYCDRFIIMDQGEIIYEGTLSDIQKQTGKQDESLEKIFIGAVKG
jgi:ABC-2 type transport system ATP-binding protein